MNITAGGDGIQSETDVNISGGDLTISTGGGSANGSYSGGGNNILGGIGRTTATAINSGSAKGIKAANDISITGGTIDIDSADDGLHSDNSLTISGGNIKIASGDDGIHADSKCHQRWNHRYTKSYGRNGVPRHYRYGEISLSSQR